MCTDLKYRHSHRNVQSINRSKYVMITHFLETKLARGGGYGGFDETMVKHAKNQLIIRNGGVLHLRRSEREFPGFNRI